MEGENLGPPRAQFPPFKRNFLYPLIEFDFQQFPLTLAVDWTKGGKNMERFRDDSKVDPAVEFLPENLDEAMIQDLEFTVPIRAGDNSSTSSAPLLDALTTYRDAELN